MTEAVDSREHARERAGVTARLEHVLDALRRLGAGLESVRVRTRPRRRAWLLASPGDVPEVALCTLRAMAPLIEEIAVTLSGSGLELVVFEDGE